ncbi:MAG: DinB family protein [Deferribacteres bacterium]|nr:DinB family protein [candidate division KSB1 bacterium]MCB9504379.1 DinB family protein [Deferribacteres bacterium]
MIKEGYLQELEASYKFFKRSTSALTEEDSTFAPKDSMMTSAQVVAHVAQTFEWFIDGAFGENGFDKDFEKHMAEVMAYNSLENARAYFEKASGNFRDVIASKTDEQLLAPLKDTSIMGAAPCLVVIGATIEHTAHHRGALSVYTRLCGKVPPMPYSE